MKLLADENFNNDILCGIWRRVPDAQIVRVQDTSILGADDSQVLEYAAEQGYLVLPHDVNTLRGHYYERLNAGLKVPGVFLVLKKTPIGEVVDALEIILCASEAADWLGKMDYLPLR